MTKHKSPSELNTKTVRINIGDWRLLDELSHRLDITIAKALHRLITRETERQISMELNTAYSVGVHRPMSVLTAKTAIATNGSKGVAFRIKPKGARYA